MIAGSAEARAAAPDLEIVVTRELAAPRELVWAAWTEPAHAARWWGPRGFTNTIHEMDVRPGGIISIDIAVGDGQLEVSGVLAVVTTGLYLGMRMPELLTFRTRLQSGSQTPSWRTSPASVWVRNHRRAPTLSGICVCPSSGARTSHRGTVRSACPCPSTRHAFSTTTSGYAAN